MNLFSKKPFVISKKIITFTMSLLLLNLEI